MNYNDEEICNWSLNFSSEDICFSQPREDLAWDQSMSSLPGRLPPFHCGLRHQPSGSLPSIQEVEDDGNSCFSLPVNSFNTPGSYSQSKVHRKVKEDLSRRLRRKDGACNSWPTTADYCKGRCRTSVHAANSGFPLCGLQLPGSDSMKSWDSSLKCVSEGLSRGNSKDLSQFSIDDRSGSEFASTQTSKSSVAFDTSNAQSVNALEDSESSLVETHFKRDFYRLCKVESCRSLDVSCKNLMTAAESSSAAHCRHQDVLPTTPAEKDNDAQQIIRIDLVQGINGDIEDCTIQQYDVNDDAEVVNDEVQAVDLAAAAAADVMQHDHGGDKGSPSNDSRDQLFETLPQPSEKNDCMVKVSAASSLNNSFLASESLSNDQVIVHETLQDLNDIFARIDEDASEEEEEEEEERGQQQQQADFRYEENGAKLEEDPCAESSSVKEGHTTSWVHFEADVDLSDPKVSIKTFIYSHHSRNTVFLTQSDFILHELGPGST